MKSSLASIWSYALGQVSVEKRIRDSGLLRRIPKSSALLCWGKAARGASESVPAQGPRLVISPETGDHPLPGNRSFEQGARLLEFFSYLGRCQVRELTVILSGGASSLAWIKPRNLSRTELQARLQALYRAPLSIRELNQKRSRLCLLKNGGATRLLRLLAPETRARVYVLSDVAPFGPEVVGSGPFVGLRLRVLAENHDLVLAAKKRARGERILELRHSQLGNEDQWARELSRKIRAALRAGREGLLIRGGEPQVRLPARGARRGGRECQIAARLLLEFWNEIREGRVEVLCGSSDGSDGNSGAAAIHLHRGPRTLPPLTPSLQRQLKKAIESFDTAPLLRKLHFVIPAYSTGTNVQDLILVRVRR